MTKKWKSVIRPSLSLRDAESSGSAWSEIVERPVTTMYRNDPIRQPEEAPTDAPWFAQWKREKPEPLDAERLVRSIVSYQIGIPFEQVPPGAILVGDLGVDSLALEQIIVEIEEELGIDIPDEEAEGIRSVVDIVHILERLIRHESAER